jgi:hypothetical protein
MESAETTSPAQGVSPKNNSSKIPVLPDAVGPKRRRTGIAADPVNLFFYAEFDLFRKDLTGCQGNYLTVVDIYLRVLQHGKLEGSPGSGTGDFVHIAIVFD